jgi:CubicO group peptidase (beta-lactamase class C family)
VTALAIGAALGDGLIASIDDAAAPYFPEGHPLHDGGLKEEITIRDLMTMSSALDCNDNDPQSPGNEENMYPLDDWAAWVYGIPARAEKRGTWYYCTAGVVLLGKVIEQATGEKADAYIERRILKPLGVKAQNWFYSEAGDVMTGGGLELSTRDLGNLATLILNSGQWKGEQLIPASFVTDALSIHFKPNDDQDYGYLFWRRDYQTACGAQSGWYMAGNGGNAVVLFKDLKAAIVVTRTRYNTRGMHQETIDLIEQKLLPPLLGCEQ